MRAFLALFLLFFLTLPVLANPDDIGQSGSAGLQSCAMSCHGPGGGTVTVSGFPQIYNPNETYLMTIRHLDGFSIKNFNASVRLGNRTTIAGTLGAGMNTALYSVIPSESSGVHLSSFDQDSASFYWTAPGPVGPVQLFLAAHQGPRWEGPNTNIVLFANMSYPDSARNPRPNNGSQNVLPDVLLIWTPGFGTLTHDVYFGTEPDPPFFINQEDSVFDPPGSLDTATTYYWRIDERNTAGVTAGRIWSFFTRFLDTDEVPAGVPNEITLGPAYPNPFNATVTVPFSLPRAAEASLNLFDVTGRKAATLTHDVYSAGAHRIQWSAENVPSGVYLLRLEAGERTITTKVVAMK